MGRPVEIPSWAEASARRILEASGVRGPFVCLHPSAGRRTNRYPPESFGRVGDGIAEDPGLQVVLTGSADDGSLCARVATSMAGRPADLSGRLDLWELAAVASASRLFIAGDTGPLHLAVAVGARVVGVYGGAPVERTGPYGQTAGVVRSPHPCGRCYRRSCPDLPCMAAITPEAVLERARQILEVGG
jgi:ADP-heptose:LPS heptosyltransferase